MKAGDVIKWKKRNSWEPDHLRFEIVRVEEPYIYTRQIGVPDNRNPVVRREPWNYEVVEPTESPARIAVLHQRDMWRLAVERLMLRRSLIMPTTGAT